MTESFAGTATLTRLALRRDRIRLPVWLLGTAGLIAATASAIGDLYNTGPERTTNAMTRAASVVARSFTGPAPGDSAGALGMAEALVFTCVLAGLATLLTVIRHTRQNEELGRAELTGSAAVGRHANLTSALLVAGVATVGMVVLCTVLLLGAGMPAAGSVTAGLAVGASGAVFAALGAVAAQVSEGTRGAVGLGTLALGLAFLLRAAGDAFGEVGPAGTTVTAAWPSWLSPIGWSQQTLPYGENRWWPLALAALLCAAGIALAAWLSGHRDVGTGMLPIRRGEGRAAARLLSPFGLAWRLQRGVLASWVAGIAVFGLVFGGIGDQVDELLDSKATADLMRDLAGGGSIVQAYFTVIIGLLGIVIAGYTVQALLRLRGDEAGGVAEALLATAVSRPRWLASHLLCAVLGTVAVLAALGASTGLAYWLVSGDGNASVDLLKITAAQLPPTLVLAGFVVVVFGLVPRLAAMLSWAGFALCLVIGQFGELLRVPHVIIEISPFTHVPALPADPLAPTPLSIMLAIAAAALAGGVLAFRRRSLAL